MYKVAVIYVCHNVSRPKHPRGNTDLDPITTICHQHALQNAQEKILLLKVFSSKDFLFDADWSIL
jgi:hypothetical protein